MPRPSEIAAFTITPTMFQVGVAVIPNNVNVVPDSHKTAWMKA